MAIYRAPRPDHHFTQIRNAVLRDERLSYRARGLLASILSRPDDWQTGSEALARSGKEGRDAIRTALQELADAGYLVREKRQDARGRWSTHQVIYDSPEDAATHAAALPSDGALFPVEQMAKPQVTPETDSQASDNQASGNQSSDSQALLEHCYEQSSPKGEEAPGPRPAAPQDQVAKAVYDATQGMVPYMAVRQIAGRALRAKDVSVERLVQVMLGLYTGGRPITLTTVGQGLSRGSFKETNTDHWANGGQF